MAVQVFHPIANTVEVTLKAERAGEQRRNVIHYRYEAPAPTATELTALATEIEGAILGEYEDFVSIGTRWYEIVCRDVNQEFGVQIARSVNRLAAGPVDNHPGHTSHCLSKRSQFSGGSKRGRFYLIDLPEDYFNGDDMNIVYIPVVNELVTQLMIARVAGRFVPAIGSRKLQTSVPWTTTTYDLIADTQRRRGKNRGQ